MAHSRLLVLGLVAVLMTGVLGGRLVQLQLLDGPANSERASAINTRTVVVPAQRGRILASDGSVLVGNASTTTLTVDPAWLRAQKDGGRAVLTRVATLLGRSPDALLSRTKACGTKGAPRSPVCFAGQPFEPIPVASDVTAQQANAVLERPEAYPGIAAEATPTRTYGTSGPSLAQTTGYLTRTTADDLTRDASLTGEDLVGRAGIEQSYDAVLRGRDGRRVVGIAPDGSASNVVSDTPSTAGRDVVTSIDPTVQKAAAKALADGIAAARKSKGAATSGSVVVLDAQNGQLVATTNQPTYDPSVWNGGVTEAEYTALTGGSDDPLSNRAVSVAGPPASTFKAFSLLAAGRSGVDPKGTYACPSSLVIGNRSYSNFESAAYGTIDIPKALEVSCDTIFYRWAYTDWIKQGGVKAATDAASPFSSVPRTFGFGTSSGVDLPLDAAGSVPDRASLRRQWERTKATSCARASKGYPEIKDAARAAYLKQVAEENCSSGYVLRAGDAVNLAIGQGDVAVTPLQLAAGYAAIANGGRLYSPRVAARSQNVDGTDRRSVTAPLTRTVSLEPAMLSQELAGLARVMSDGTASAAFRGFDLAAYPLHGKTGTGEVYGKQATAWFASFGPKTSSGHQYVVVVRVEQGGEGGKAAAPIARKVWDVLAQKK